MLAWHLLESCGYHDDREVDFGLGPSLRAMDSIAPVVYGTISCTGYHVRHYWHAWIQRGNEAKRAFPNDSMVTIRTQRAHKQGP